MIREFQRGAAIDRSDRVADDGHLMAQSVEMKTARVVRRREEAVAVESGWRIEVANREGCADPIAAACLSDLRDLRIAGVDAVRTTMVYWPEGAVAQADARRIAEDLLTDPVIQQCELAPISSPAASAGGERGGVSAASSWWSIEVTYLPGVMNPWEESIAKGIRDLGIGGITRIRTARRYLLCGSATREQVTLFAQRALYNPLVQMATIYRGDEPATSLEPRAASPGWSTAGDHRPATDLAARSLPFAAGDGVRTVALRNVDDAALQRISRSGQLSLNLEEMRAIQAYARQIGRDPTETELETIAQTWSEHCCHKTMKGLIEYEEVRRSSSGASRIVKRRTIDNLLKATIVRATRRLKKPWCVSVFEDNAGIIRLDQRWGIAFKVETHNHPSALEPYGGAETGVGGVIRDILGAGLGAKPLVNTDVFCFGPWAMPFERLPAGVLHPKRVMRGVVAGVRDYGNRMGIPTANGAICFEEGFVANPLVYCGTVGLIPLDRCRKEVRRGDRIVLVGGRTGRDGIHGATFSSAELTDGSETTSRSAVQIGNAITEKKVLDVLLVARDRALYRSITDCGAGGLSSAVGEMGRHTGAVVHLERVPLKYDGLTPTEIWISESQERMVLAVDPSCVEALLMLCQSEDVEATEIGLFNGGRLCVLSHGVSVVDLDATFLHDGVPRRRRRAVWEEDAPPSVLRSAAASGVGGARRPVDTSAADLGAALMRVLSDGNVCSKETVIRQYDHEVQGMSVLKPLVGSAHAGPSDACVIRPLPESSAGVAIACGINPRYGRIDPYRMAGACIDEAIRQVVAVGARLDRIALLDNFCWGDPEDPAQLGGLVRAAQACHDYAVAYGAPFISGKDSLNNTYLSGGTLVSIPPTLLISAVALMPDVARVVSMDVKRAGGLIYLIGLTGDELGGSVYHAVYGAAADGEVPQADAQLGRRLMRALERAIASGWVRAAHDCSEGGLGVACAEMAFAGGLGMAIDLRRVPFQKHVARSMTYDPRPATGVVRDDVIFFSESTSRFVVEVAPKDRARFERLFKGLPFGLLGRVTSERRFEVAGLDGRQVVSCGIDALQRAWQHPLEGVI